MTSLFCCPVCGAPLEREERVYRCPGGHSYDIAKEGYTYLLPPNRKHSADPGDDKAMAAAPTGFLSKGYYSPLLNTICNWINTLPDEGPVILDAGCGEGYYTSGIGRRGCGRETTQNGGYRYLPLHSASGGQAGKIRGTGRGLLFPSSLCR